MFRRRAIPTRLRRRPRLAATVALLAAVVGLGAGPAQDDVDATRAAAVKAAYLYNFVNFERLRFVTWPERALGEAETPIIIGIVGTDPFGPVIDHTFSGKRIGHRSIVIHRLGAWPTDDVEPVAARRVREACGGCHLLFVSDSEAEHVPEIVAALDDRPVLTVSDIEGFARAGGIIELALDEGRIVMRINRTAGERASLRMSSKLLSLATIVETDVEETPR